MCVCERRVIINVCMHIPKSEAQNNEIAAEQRKERTQLSFVTHLAKRRIERNCLGARGREFYMYRDFSQTLPNDMLNLIVSIV